ncbi:MAG: rhodanese-related sulfurtransferase [Bradymonadia bacterium]|jgi:rhodanese-related sulfurtransferase
MDKSTLLGILLVAVVALFVLFGRAGGGEARVSGAEAHELVANGAQLLDVRTPGEFSGGHIDGAVNIPVQELSGRLGELSQAQPVVVYCRSGARSSNAARSLQAAGFEAVHDLGPMSAW